MYLYAYGFQRAGVPVPIVAISAGIAHDQYGHDDLWVVGCNL